MLSMGHTDIAVAEEIIISGSGNIIIIISLLFPINPATRVAWRTVLLLFKSQEG
jgi:hypothetical protein